MKKLLGLAMAAALLASCSNDDDSKVDMSKLTSGKWYFSSEKTIVAGHTIDDSAYEHDCSTSKDYTEFSSTTFVDAYYDSDCDMYTDTYSYSVNGHTITSTIDGYTETATVKELNSNKLVVETTDTYEGVTTTYQTTLTKN